MSDRPPIEIYSIGTELLNGQIQDTNSFWMAQQIAALTAEEKAVLNIAAF